MSTNYYLKRTIPNNVKDKMKEYLDNDDYDKLSETLHSYDPIHIGKKSYGWKFLFNFNNFKYYQPNKESLYEFLKSGTIIDEYNSIIPFDEFEYIMTNESNDIDTLIYYTDPKYANSRGNYQPNVSKLQLQKYKDLYGIDVNRVGEFYIDGIRFTTCTDFC